MSSGPFQSRTVLAIVIVTGASFLLALGLAIFGPELTPPRSVSSDAYSYSSLGHKALVESLRRLGIPVVVSRSASTAKARATGVLVIAEPTHYEEVDEQGRTTLEQLLRRSEFTLLVLPKRAGVRDPLRPGWVGPVRDLGVGPPEAVLRAAGIEANVRHLPFEAVGQIQSRVGAVPTFTRGPVQVIEGPGLLPLVSTAGGGTLVAHVTTNPGLYVLADPDPITNAGFHHGENGFFFLRVLEHVRDGYESVVFDETIHGHAAASSIWRELFRFPLVLVVIHLALVIGVLLWAAMGRFGSPEAAPSVLEPGRGFLVDRSAELLQAGARTSQALPRYLDVSLRDARRALDAPPTLRGDALDGWLDRIARSRGVTDRVSDLRDAVRGAAGSRAHALGVARRIHLWRTEILHGAQ